jgi:ribosomal protein S12 methylthiotransferase RimO
VWLTTLGCAKNEVDSEKVTALLDHAGYRRASDPEQADVVMVNTCAFIEEARRESIDTILDMAGSKREDAKLVVLGCMAQRYETELVAELPEADAVIGLDRYGELVGRLDEMTGASTVWQPIEIRSSAARRPAMDILYETARPTPSMPYAYVKIAEGCDKVCTFCAIPQFRGKQRSRDPQNVRREIAELVAHGVGEIGLVAQDLAAFGRDRSESLPFDADIVDLLRTATDVEGLRLVRLYYLYPREIRPALIEEMASNPRIANYFDLSLQHASVDLLRSMKRPGSGAGHLDLIGDIRTAAPDAAMRSSFIVGFPGETEDHVDEMADFLTEARLDWAGFFPFSAEEGTAAVDLAGRVDRDEITARLRHLQQIQDEITLDRNLERIGVITSVLIDQVEDGQPVGRSYRQAPEIDGVILLDKGQPGEWVQAEISGAFGTDLEAVVVG